MLIESEELIDTQWDVNIYPTCIVVISISELIDTQWDVNTVQILQTVQTVPGINRYIVGCKFEKTGEDITFSIELIDTQWDVNKRERETTDCHWKN